jgi:molecular chaperone GrpE
MTNKNTKNINTNKKTKNIKKNNIKNIKTKKNKLKKTIKINYKKEYEKLKKEILKVREQKNNIEKENQKNLIEFQILAKTFQSKAQDQINKIKKELENKLQKDKEDIKKYGAQKLLEEIIEPILNIELAVKVGKNDENVAAYVKGFEMLINQIYQELQKFGVSLIEPKIGSEFNPKEHQILNFSEKKGKKNTISKVNKKGFKLHDRVFKVAIVETYK